MPPKKKQAEKADKRYRAKITIPGVDKPVWVAAKTKAALEEEKRRVKEEYVAGPHRKNLPFADLVQEWWEVVKKPRVKAPGTMRLWEGILRLWVIPCFPPRKMCRAVSRRDLQDCLDKAAGLNSNHLIIIKSCLVNSCKYGLAEGILRADPSVLLTKPAAKPSSPKRPFTRTEESIILRTASEIGGVEEALVTILYYTGMRIGEALGLRWEDVLWQKELIHVQRDVDARLPDKVGTLKTKAANRYIPIPAPLLAWLKPRRGLPQNYILTGTNQTISAWGANLALRRVFGACGYCEQKDEKKSGPRDIQPWFSAHYFRHHYVTSCVQADLRPEYIMSIVGHASYGVTIGVYTHIQHQMLEDNFQATLLSEILKSETKVAKRLPDEKSKTQIFQ